jgi:3-methyl-2-oxobutanoate hydroxymethyltransferase
MIHHSRAVHRALKTSYIVTDLPFASYESSPQQAFESAAKLLRDGHAEAVKLEGGKEMAATISHLVNVGVPVMGHVGLMPQRAKALGGFRVQGNTAVKVTLSFVVDVDLGGEVIGGCFCCTTSWCVFNCS